jgi:hypothetical protein
MSLFKTECGRVIRLDDSPPHNNQPLRTKIVATIGSETSYADGIQDLDGRRVGAPTYDYIVRQFYESGVDVIRLNLSHIKLDKIGSTFSAVKAAVRACERENNNRKRIALLADLPGPKIRFALDNYIFHVGDEFTVHFESERPPGKAATVYVDAAPLKVCLAKHGRHGRKLPPWGVQDVPQEVIENVLAKEFTEAASQSAPFKSMMEQIKRRIVARERVLAVVGDGDVLQESWLPATASCPSASARPVRAKAPTTSSHSVLPSGTRTTTCATSWKRTTRLYLPPARASASPAQPTSYR